ncbi:unnamed protein product, partial [Mesorhabditis belari]|uniref:Uncharacterized protein n=1 Tax=Mesorhabditis belari TaxID=2138241 RepID=A0AAF3EFB3_9BILA
MQELEERKEHLNGEEETRERKQHELRIAKDRVNAVKAMETSQKEQADRKLADINKQLSAARQEARLLQTGSWKLTDHNDKMAGGDDVALEKKRKIKTEISSTDRLLPRKEQLLSQFNQPKAQSQPMRDGMLNAKRRSSFNKNNARTQGLVDSEDGDEVRPIPVVLPPDVEWASQHGGQVYAAIVEDNSTPFDAFKNSRMTDAVPAELTKGSGMNNFTDTQASELTLAPETINVLTQMDENHDNSIVNETMETEYDSFEGTLDFSMNRNQMDIEGRFPADIFLHTDPTKATRDPTTTHDEASSTERTENPSEVDEASLRAIAPSRRPHESQSLDDTIATIQTQDTIDDPFDDDLF